MANKTAAQKFDFFFLTSFLFDEKVYTLSVYGHKQDHALVYTVVDKGNNLSLLFEIAPNNNNAIINNSTTHNNDSLNKHILELIQDFHNRQYC